MTFKLQVKPAVRHRGPRRAVSPALRAAGGSRRGVEEAAAPVAASRSRAEPVSAAGLVFWIHGRHRDIRGEFTGAEAERDGALSTTMAASERHKDLDDLENLPSL